MSQTAKCYSALDIKNIVFDIDWIRKQIALIKLLQTYPAAFIDYLVVALLESILVMPCTHCT